MVEVSEKKKTLVEKTGEMILDLMEVENTTIQERLDEILEEIPNNKVDKLFNLFVGVKAIKELK